MAIRPYLDAANIDLKGFDESFYKKVCKAELPKVLDTIRTYRKLNIWIELTTLIIPGHNDSEEELRAIAKFIVNELGPQVPWHVSAFYPTYKLPDAPPTSPKTLKRAREIGLEEGLRYVYEGNIPGSDGEHTYCYSCKKPVIKRLRIHNYWNIISKIVPVFFACAIDGWNRVCRKDFTRKDEFGIT